MSNFPIHRRTLLVGATSLLARSKTVQAAPSPIRAIAFDGFPIFDPRSIPMLARDMLGERGELLAAQWSNKIFSYSWLLTAAGHYQDFRTLAETTLSYTAHAMDLTLDDNTRQRLINQYESLDIWPDVKPALERLRTANIRLAFLSNLGATTLMANMNRNGIASYFEAPISTDRVKRFKPAPEAYKMAVDAFGLPREQIGFAAFGGWDAIGATWFGYRTAWVNRLGLPAEPFDIRPEITSRGMEGVLTLAGLT